jgi:hypothetical protein
VDERYHKELLDAELARLMPTSVEIHRVAAIPLSLTAPIGLTDLSLRSWSAVGRKVTELIKRSPIHAVFMTGWPFYQMLWAPKVRAMGVPVVLDFQDPWVSAWGAQQTKWSKSGLTHNLGRFLEPRALTGASFVTSVSEVQNHEMAERYPWLDPSRMAAIPIGGDPDDFAYLKWRPEAVYAGAVDPHRVNISFVGTFMPRSGPVLLLVFRALDKLRRENPEAAARIRLNFIGTSNQPGDTASYRVTQLAEEVGVADAVYEIPQRLPYLQALAVIARSDVALLVGSDEPHYTASKIYPAMMSGRPYLSLFHAASSSHSILSAAGGGLAHAYAGDRSEQELVDDLSVSLARIVGDPSGIGPVNPAAYAAYEARTIAARYADIFDRLSGKR